MKRTALMFSIGMLALILTGCGSLTGRDCGVCYKGIGFSGSVTHAQEGSK